MKDITVTFSTGLKRHQYSPGELRNIKFIISQNSIRSEYITNTKCTMANYTEADGVSDLKFNFFLQQEPFLTAA